MKLAEALIERAALQRQVDQLQARIVQSARHQEGEEPAEDAGALLQQAEEALEALGGLVLAINLANASAVLPDGTTLTAALAERDALRRLHALIGSAADAAAGGGNGYRQLRTELRWVPALPVADLRRRVDDVARRLRELEARIQRANWEVDLQQR